jgi:hypothetical protein
MRSKRFKLKAKELETFFQHMLRKWREKEILSLLMTSTGVSREISLGPESLLMKSCKINLQEAKSKNTTNMAATTKDMLQIPPQKIDHRFFLTSMRTLKICTTTDKRKTCQSSKLEEVKELLNMDLLQETIIRRQLLISTMKRTLIRMLLQITIGKVVV